MIMSFCKKGFHSFLSLTNQNDTTPSPPPPSKCQDMVGVGLSTATGNTLRPPNVLESATIRTPPPIVKESSSFFSDEVGGVVMDGLMSCTEGLGCESSGAMKMEDEEWCTSRTVSSGWWLRRREASERRKERLEKRFPPLISSLNSKGQRNFVLRSVRRDGRLEVTEVRVDRPEILRASREDGRLRLDMVVDNEEEEEEEEEEEIEKKVSLMAGGEGFGRCHEVVNHRSNHHHHPNNMWRQQPCVTIR